MPHILTFNYTAYNRYAEVTCSCGWKSEQYPYSDGYNLRAAAQARGAGYDHIRLPHRTGA